MAYFSLLIIFTLLSTHYSQASNATPQVLLALTHTLSHSNSTTPTPTHHLLKASAARSAARHNQRRQVSLPLSPGSDYTLSLSLAPSTTVNLYMDTGSDLVWFPCSPFECILCEGKPPLSPSPPPPPPTSSSPLHCSSSSCSAAHSHAPSSDLCAAAACPLDDIETSSCHSPCPAFYYAYGDGSLVAHLRRGPLTLASGSGERLQINDFNFACAHSTLAEPVGVAGFGGGLLSLPAQLKTLHPGLGGRFSYCLVSHAFTADRLVRPSPLILGRTDEPERFAYTYTPMLHNPKHPYFYSVGLDGVSIGPIRIPAGPQLSAVDRSGNGGMVVDSGTTFTMLPSGLHARITGVFDRAMNQTGFSRAVRVESETGLGPCYWYSGRGNGRKVPGLSLHFTGNASIVLPRRNYFMGFEHAGRRVGCMMLMDGGDDAVDGPAATMGNFQQQGFEVVYDLEGRRVGFARRPCAAMWEEATRG